MANMRKLPVGIQDFQKLREESFVYVDKTALIYRLVQNSCHYFLSRPRRFGKSLLVSTLEAYFTGRKELFEGLAISGLEKEWAEYPVLHFDFNGQNYSDPEGLNMMIDAHLRKWEERYGIEKKSPSPGLRLADIIDGACRQSGRKVVVLVDEYDKPLLETMVLSDEQIEANRAVFKGMFGQLKNLDGKLRFVLFTGVTKFSKVSIFSDLNQLRDISMDEAFAGICGITQEELEKDFSPEIDEMAKENGMTREACISKLKQLYDGYHFSKDSPDIYNPFSLLNAFTDYKFDRYWINREFCEAKLVEQAPRLARFGTGTPTFLVKRLKEMNFNPRTFSDGSLYSSEDEISDYRPDNPDIVPLLYQSGYLTIKAYDSEFDSLTLGYPNDEVKYGFTASLAPVYLNSPSPLDVRSFGRDIKDCNTDGLRDRFTALFARLPYANGTADDAMLERDFQNVVYLTFLLLGQFVQVEQHTAKGRADCIVETDRYVYVFEFKRDGSADEALAQIEAQGYAAPFAADSRTLVRVGAVFSSEQKNISEWKVLGK